MKQKFKGWGAVAECLYADADNFEQCKTPLYAGQRASLRAIATRIVNNGVLIADEVGMGKTRIAVQVARAVSECGGRVAILIPPGLSYQWQAELRDGKVFDVNPVLRSVQAYLRAWAADEAEKQKPWFDFPVVLVSHALANWRLDGVSSWRWALLPELYAQWRKASDGRLPRDYHNPRVEWSNNCVRTAAESICHCVAKCAKKHPIRRKLDDLVEKHVGLWPHTFLDGNAYSKNATLRNWLECSIGFGLGVFDLIIIDESHKSRREESGLSRLLHNVIVPSNSGRRLALTATPVELEASQWIITLKRLGLDKEQLRPIAEAVSRYVNAVKAVQVTWRTSPESRLEYRKSASKFEASLSHYLLRRDKREDLSVQLFAKHFGPPIDAYRDEKEILVESETLTVPWKQAICAAESLSFVTRLSDNSEAKRLRLTLGNGHGIAALLDQVKRDDADNKQEEADTTEKKSDNTGELASTDAKQQARVTWWVRQLKQAFAKGDKSLYSHPAIVAAANAIEEETQRDQKVLVFGRFNRPLRALLDLPNARELLRRLGTGQMWPQSEINESSSEWEAIQAVLIEQGRSLNLSDLNHQLGKNYNRNRHQRETFRDKLVAALERGFAVSMDDPSADPKVLQIFGAFKRATEESIVTAQGRENRPLVLVARAMSEDIGVSHEEYSDSQCVAAFCDLIQAVSDRDDAETDKQPSDEEATELWETIEVRLHEEYGTSQRGFARLMLGGMKPHSLRMIQLAFNRPNSFTKVLVAQSMVGREGLNLHESCRIVMLLHPEWNPGVVEQQIGRIDRYNSRWSRELNKAVDGGRQADELPRIEVRPVVFKGTYDEHHWKVLRMRWDELRSQLHGIVIPPTVEAENPEQQKLLDELRAAAPNFSPTRSTKLSHLTGDLE